MIIYLIAFTVKGTALCSTLTKKLNNNNIKAKAFSKYLQTDTDSSYVSLKQFTKEAFEESNAIIFIGATGIAVRAISPFITSKDKDPAIIVIDELGQHVIPILSGHIGGANELAIKITQLIGGKAIITTATDLNEKFAIDLWAKENHLYIENISMVKYISAALLNEKKIGFSCNYEIVGQLPDFISEKEKEVGIQIGETKEKDKFKKTLKLLPKQYFVGIGCKKNTNENALEEFFLQVLKENNISQNLVNSIATINIKQKEKAIVSLCKKYSYPLKTYTSEQLGKLKGNFTSSQFVKSIVGVDNVCERAAVMASNQGNLILRKLSKNGITIAIAVSDWKCRFKNIN